MIIEIFYGCLYFSRQREGNQMNNDISYIEEIIKLERKRITLEIRIDALRRYIYHWDKKLSENQPKFNDFRDECVDLFGWNEVDVIGDVEDLTK